MTYYDAWIETPDDADLVKVQQPLGERRKERSPWLPDGREIFSTVQEMAESDPVKGHQIDWGSFGVLMKRCDIELFMTKIYGPPGKYEARWAGMEHLVEHIRDVRAFVAQLPESDYYELVVTEF